jgi:exodeoxyribonuclease VII large subunit
MNPLFSFAPVTITVSELNHYLHQLLESDEVLQEVWVLGEISNLAWPSSGHLYFTLKDSSAAIRCVMWRSSVAKIKIDVRDGMAVEIHGSVNIYEASGQIQIYVDLIRSSGEGAQYQEFLRLKARLEAEGLFDSERKRSIPAFPDRIGIVTSPTGAALQDILNTIRRRFPLAEVIVSPAPVQGEDAPPRIVAAIERLNRMAHPDVILLARGGGSLEDLWPFNDERVARAIVASDAPVISGVGHETDFSIADFVADLRAPTPTAAAELATPDQADLWAALGIEATKLGKIMENKIQDNRWQLRNQASRLQQYSPLHQIQNDQQRVDELIHRSQIAMNNLLQFTRARIESYQIRLENLNPRAVLNRGYAIVTSGEGRKVISSVQQVTQGESLTVQVMDGEFEVDVTQTNSPNREKSNA